MKTKTNIRAGDRGSVSVTTTTTTTTAPTTP